MRQDIITYLSAQNLGTFKVALELPFTSNGESLYIKNPKRIYVDTDVVTQDTVIATLDGQTFENETTTVRAYFATDAKNLPSNYDSLVSLVQAGRNVSTITGVHTRICNVNKTYEQDLLVTEFEFEFTKLI